MGQFSGELTVEKAAEYLAARRVRARRAIGISKAAQAKHADLSGILGSLGTEAGKVWNAAPGSSQEAIRNALIGAGVGGGLGGAASLMRGSKKRRTLSDILGGAAVGAGVGGAGTLGARALQQLGTPSESQQQAAQATTQQQADQKARGKVVSDLLNSSADQQQPTFDRVAAGTGAVGNSAAGLFSGESSVKDLVNTTGTAIGNLTPPGSWDPAVWAKAHPLMGLLDRVAGSGEGTGNATKDVTGTNPGQLYGTVVGGYAGNKAVGQADLMTGGPAKYLRDLAVNGGEEGAKAIRDHFDYQKPQKGKPGAAPTPAAPDPVAALKSMPKTPTMGQRWRYGSMAPQLGPLGAEQLRGLANKQTRMFNNPAARGVGTLGGMAVGNYLGRLFDKNVLGY